LQQLLTVLELSTFVQSRVARETKGQQNPLYDRLSGEGQFLFLLPTTSRPIGVFDKTSDTQSHMPRREWQ
jgi:hypothetical protein